MLNAIAIHLVILFIKDFT